MPHSKEKIAAIFLLLSLAAYAKDEPSAKVVVGKAGVHARIAKPSAAVEAPPPPEPVSIPSMTPEELPASAPRVTYSGGRLTIDAANTMLVDILSAIQVQTGAVIDMPRDGSSERVAVHLSGPPNLVIPELLDGSPFGYVIRASSNDPEGVQEVVLTRKPMSGTPQSGQTVMARPFAEPDPALMSSPAPAGKEIADNTPYRNLAVPEQTLPAQPGSARPIVATDESGKSEDKPDQLATPTQPTPSASTVDPHPTPPVQLTANLQNADQAKQQRDTNRQFMQDLYGSRQKLQQPQQQETPQNQQP